MNLIKRKSKEELINHRYNRKKIKSTGLEMNKDREILMVIKSCKKEVFKQIEPLGIRKYIRKDKKKRYKHL